MSGPSIVSTTPASGATGVPTNISISITFDQEVDTFRLKNGGLILEGPDESKAIGPGMIGLDPPRTDEDDFLTSPGFKGIKEVEYSFQRVDGSGQSVDYYDYGDTPTAGQIYRTRVVITPLRPLESLTEHTLYIIGDEDTSDEYDYGLSTRTVFDPLKGANLGNGDVVFYGGYTGSHRQQFSIEITSAGIAGVAEYEWWTSTDAIHRTGTTSIGYRVLKDGLKAKFLEGRQYEVGDLFTVWCDLPVFMDGSYKFSFVTSSHAPEELPVSSSLITGTSTVLTGTSTSTSTFSVLETNPEDRAAFVSSDITLVTITFNNSINPATVSDTTVTINGKAADGSLSGNPEFTDVLSKTLLVSGDTLQITLDPDEVFQNNLIVITLDDTIADIDGLTLGSDYSFFFGTELTPFYAGIRHVRLRLGSLGNNFADETIALAIWDASREALAFATPLVAISNSAGYERARNQFVVCFAAWILASGGVRGIGDSVRKRLGDFDVSRSSATGGNVLYNDLKDCIDYYLGVMENGGALGPVHKPLNVVKGDNDIDSPLIGRLWVTGSQPISNSKVSTSGSRRWFKTYLSRQRRTSRS